MVPGVRGGGDRITAPPAPSHATHDAWRGCCDYAPPARAIRTPGRVSGRLPRGTRNPSTPAPVDDNGPTVSRLPYAAPAARASIGGAAASASPPAASRSQTAATFCESQ